MPLGFLPGEPNDTSNSCSFVNWNTIQILAYTSGNNLVIFTKNSTHLQTIYLPADSFVVDANKVNGKIAVAIKNQVYVYTPEISNCYNFIFHGRKNLDELRIEWTLEHIITNEDDQSDITCLSWSDYSEVSDMDLDSQFLDLPPEFNSKTLCELVTGSNNSLTMHQLSYCNENNEKSMKCKLVWHKKQPNPVYKVKFSPNATCIASIGRYDKNVKLWHRIGFDTEFCDFELHYLLHDAYVTDIFWKNHMNSTDPSNKDVKKTSPMDMTPTSNNILKPANSIIKSVSRLALSEKSGSGLSVENQHNVLYTITNNSLLKVYSTYRLERGFEIFNSGSLDLYAGESFKRDHGIIKSVVFIDNPYLELGIESLLDDTKVEKSSVELDSPTRKKHKLLDLMNAKCELCMIIGSDGEVRLYGLSNLCNPLPTNMSSFLIDKFKQNGQTFNARIKLSKYCLPTIPNAFLLKSIQINHYSEKMTLTLVIHDFFKNTIRELGFTFGELLQFDRSRSLKDEGKKYPVKDISIGCLQQKFTGHNKSVKKLIRSTDGSSILSVTRFNENYLWSPIYLTNGRTTLTKKSIIITNSPVINAVIWKNGDYVFALLKDKLICYDCLHSDEASGRVARNVLSLDIKIDMDPECVFFLPESSATKCHLVMIFKNGECRSFQFSILNQSEENNKNKASYELFECSIQDLNAPEKDDLHIISAINPVGWKQFIGRAGRDVLATVSSTGLVSIYYVTFSGNNKDKTICWHLKDKFRTGVQRCSFISCSSINKMAIVDESKTKLSIWDMKVGVMDYFEEFQGEVIKDLDWTSTVYGQGILAVGFKLHSLLYTQLRYDYTNNNLSFAKIKQVDISDQTTHEIGDSIWMEDGLLVIGAGNQLYLSDKKIDDKDFTATKAIGTLEILSNDIFHLCSALNGPLPLYHPQFIIQLLFSGRHTLIKSILTRLSVVLREIDLGKRKDDDFDLGIPISAIMSHNNSAADEELQCGDTNMSHLNSTNDETEFNEQCGEILIEKLQKLRLPFLSGHQQITLSHTVSIMKGILLKYVKVLDINGLKFYLTMKLFMVNMGREMMRNMNKSIRMRDMTFALHSDNKDLLYNIVDEQAEMKIDWLNAKRYLLSYWMEGNKLKSVIEKIAANEFLKFQNENGGKKDPTTCSIFYLTLKKKHILIGLWKNSIGHSERDKMVRFLSHDFTEKRWKSAALKNAYVLLGKHRYIEAASFFLLADSPKDAVNVIVKQLDDVALAVAVARCYEGCDNGPSMRSILERQILTDAITTNDRWKLSWVFWILGDKPHAAQALIKPLHHIKDDIEKLLPNYKWVNIDNVIRTSNTEDPVLLVMYDSLRNRNVAYYRGIAAVKPEHEFSFVIKAATMYSRMGCDWLALYLVKKWKFSSQEKMDDVSSDIPARDSYPNDNSQRKRPGDILAKFMSDSAGSPSESPTLPNTGHTSNLLDSFMDPEIGNGHSILDSYSNPPNVSTRKAPNLLDSYSTSNAKPVKVNSLLDNYTVSEEAKTDTAASTKAKPVVTNMLDAWT
ncbi:hypothetical protein PMKS-001080 [Pichia membranifaciens]|uniref:RAVE complex protein Rav1 C-terminal domain-containing protein n=1 Tax=Pichia membranifaciens TaxID=4926 RepID=A0A1Q2YDK7_9ASCO|nr:hypothetical protein PMKS-001080 [Pichia membranifaciens]